MALIKKNTLSWFDYFLIVGVVGSMLIYAYLNKEFDPIGFIAGVAGVICVVLVAKGNILNYAFGLVNVSLYAYISFKSSLWGDAAINGLYYVPMQFFGFFSWRKKIQSDDPTKVKANRMTTKQLIVLVIVSVVSVALTGYILQRFDDPQPYKDATTTVFAVIAQFLMVKAFAEQWYLWLIVNIISVIIWVLFAVNGKPHAVMMVIMYVFYLANSINGIIQWRKLSRQANVYKSQE